jgi:dihydrofolate synthase / folylpolyglutamate synthase
VLLDAAHNPEGARSLRAYLAQWHPDRPPLVVGIMRDKDADGILRELLPVTSSLIATTAGTTRALPAEELARRAATLDPERDVLVCADALKAVDLAFERGQTVCVAGSIVLAGAVRDGLERRDILH